MDRLISSPRRPNSSFCSKTERFPAKKGLQGQTHETVFYKDEWAQSLHTKAQSTPMTRAYGEKGLGDKLRTGQDWTFNSTDRRAKGRLSPSEWDGKIRTSATTSSQPIRHLPMQD